MQVEQLRAFEGDRSKLGNAEKFLDLVSKLPHYRLRVEGTLFLLMSQCSKLHSPSLTRFNKNLGLFPHLKGSNQSS